MKANKLLAGALALAITAGSIFSPVNLTSAKAATEKEMIDLKFKGDYTLKKISDADTTALAKAFGYTTPATGVHVCGENTSGYVDWENSPVESWQVYATEVFQPVLSRDANGNLVVGKDTDGNLQKAWSTYAFYPTQTAGVIAHQNLYREETVSDGGSFLAVSYGNTYDKTNEELNQGKARGGFENRAVTDTYVPAGSCYYDYVLSENHFCLSPVCDKQIQTINSHLGLTELTTWHSTGITEGGAFGEPFAYYVSEQTQISDAYVIRVYYTTDDIPLNWMQRNYLGDVSALNDVEVTDVYGKSYGKIYSGYELEQLSVGTKDRLFGCTDIWILPDRVDTVLNLEDASPDEIASATTSTALQKGATFTAGNYKYKVTSASTVAFAGVASSKTTNVVIPKTVTYGGKKYKVTSVAANALKNKTKVTSVTIGANVKKIGAAAFSGCKNLKTITIKSEKLTNVGKQALKNISATAKVKVPKSKLADYKKLFKDKGQGSKVSIVILGNAK